MIFGKKRLCFAIVLLSAIVFSLPVNADQLSIDNVFFGYNLDVNYTPPTPLNTDTGTFQVKYEGFETWGYCVDLGTKLDISATGEYANLFSYTTPTDPVNLFSVEWLLDKYGRDIYSRKSATEGAALQLAIWETMYTDDFSYNATEINSIDSSINGFYNEYINALGLANIDSSYVSTGNYVVVADLVGTDSQGQEYYAQDIIVNVVPEPTTALLLGFGLLGLCGLGRRRV